MSGVKPFTIISGGANGVDLEAERFARDFGLPVQIFIPPCHPRSKYLSPLTHSQLGEAIPITKQVIEQTFEQSHQLTIHSPKLSCGETSRNGTGFYKLST